MRTAGIAFLAATATAVVLTPLVRSLARRWGFLDHALSSRKLHGHPIPRLGGVAIVGAFFAPLAALYFVDSEVGRRFYQDPRHAAGLFVGGLAIALLGVFDDLRGAGAKKKFLVQFAVAALMYALGFRIDHIANPFGPQLDLGIFALPFTMLWIAGVINAMNLIDGLDGLAGGVALIAIGSTFAIAALRGEPLMLLFTAALGGAVLGFLFYNFNPATIFMGDTGSMFLGFVLATTAIQTNQKSSTAVALIVPVVALGVPIADTLLAMARRAARGAPLFSADRGHIHHRLLALGLSQRQAVVLLYVVCLLLGAGAIAMSFADRVQSACFLLTLSLAGYLALRRLGYFSLARTMEVLGDRKRNGALRAAVREASAVLRRARSAQELWTVVRAAARAVGASAVALHAEALPAPPGAGYREGFNGRGGLLRARFSLLGERPGADHLELGWSDGRVEVDRDTEIAVEVLCAHVAAAVQRVAPRDAGVLPFGRTGSE